MRVSRTTLVKRSLNAVGILKDVIGEIRHDTSLFAITRGQISMIDAINHCVDSVSRNGPADISMWSWCVADYELDCVETLMTNNKIKSALLVLDRAGMKRNMDLVDLWIKRFGERSIRFCMNHAKIATVASGDLRVAIRGSMNLNFNPRFENMDISTNDGAYELIKEIESELTLFNPVNTNAECAKQSQVSKAFDAKTLEMFGMKVWRK